MSSVARWRLTADDELVRRAAGDEPQQAMNLVEERRLLDIGFRDPTGIPRLGDRDVDARADELDAQIDRLRDLAGRRVRE